MATTRPLCFLLLFGAVISINCTFQTNNPSISNIEITCMEDGFFPYPNDCTKYYRCVSQRRYDYDCGPGTHYNPSIIGCDHPHSAGCQFAIPSNGSTNNRESTSEVEVMTASPFYPDTSNTEHDGTFSNEYIDCVNVCQSKHHPTFDRLRKDHFQRASIRVNYHPEITQMIVEPGYVYYRKKVITTGDNKGKWENLNTYEEFNEGNWQKQFGKPDWNRQHHESHSTVNVPSSSQTTTFKIVNITKKKILIPFVIQTENGKSTTVQNYTYEELNHGAELAPLQKLKTCDQSNLLSEKMCAASTFEWFKIGDTELERPKPKREIKLNSTAVDLFQECHHHCTLLRNKENNDRNFKVACLAFSFSLESQKCFLYDHLKLPFNWLNELVTNKKPKGFRSKRHTSTVIKIPQTYSLENGRWLVGPSVPKDLVKKGKSEDYILLEITYDSIYNCLAACSNNKGCIQFTFDSNTGRCFIKKDKTDEKEDSSEEEEDTNEIKSVYWSMGWLSGEDVEHFALANKDKVQIVELNEIVKVPSNENQIGYLELGNPFNEDLTSQTKKPTANQIGYLELGNPFNDDLKSQTKKPTANQIGNLELGNPFNEDSPSQTKKPTANQIGYLELGNPFNDDLTSQTTKPTAKNISNKGATTHMHLIKTTIISGQTVCLEEGLFPHTSSCSKFYECSNGQIFAKDCAPGTLYNPLIKQCDHPEKSGCTVNKQGQVEFVWKEVFTVNEENSDIENQLNVNRPFETTQHVSSVRTITSQKIVCLKEGIFPHPTSCVHFYVCRNGELSTQNCSQEGTMYNPLTNVCDVPEKSGCKIGTNGQVEFEWKSEIKTDLPNGHHYHHHHITNEMDQSNVVVDSKEKSFTISKTICLEEGLFPHSTSCNKFYHCAHGQLFTKDCAPGTHYNPLIKTCDFIKEAGCSLNSNGQTQFEWKFTSTSQTYSGEHKIGDNKKKTTTTTTTTVRRHMLIPFVVNDTKEVINGHNHDHNYTGRLVSEEFVAEHDGIGLKLKNVPSCSSTANHRLCTFENFNWLQITDQEFVIKERSTKELTVEKLKNIAEECHRACQEISCIAYSFNGESRKCTLYEQITLEVSWLDGLLGNDPKKVKQFRKKRHTVSRVFLPQTFIAHYQWIISPSVPRDLATKKKLNDYQVFELANANVLECIAVCEHSPKRCVKFVFDQVHGKCFLKKEKPQKVNEEEKDSSEEEDDEEEEKYRKIVYRTGWLSGRNLKELVNQGHVLKETNQKIADNDLDLQHELRTKEYIEIFKPTVPNDQNQITTNQTVKPISPTFDKTNCIEGYFYHHLKSCSKFYFCKKGKLISKECNTGTLFNPLTKTCDFPEQSGCRVGANGFVEFEWKTVTQTSSSSQNGYPQLNHDGSNEPTKTTTSTKIVKLINGTVVEMPEKITTTEGDTKEPEDFIITEQKPVEANQNVFHPTSTPIPIFEATRETPENVIITSGEMSPAYYEVPVTVNEHKENIYPTTPSYKPVDTNVIHPEANNYEQQEVVDEPSKSFEKTNKTLPLQVEDETVIITTNAHQNSDLTPLNQKKEKSVVETKIVSNSETPSTPLQPDHDDAKTKKLKKYLLSRDYWITIPELHKLIKKVIQTTVKRTIVVPEIKYLHVSDILSFQENYFTVGEQGDEPESLPKDTEHMNKIKECDSGNGTTPCTLNNFEWLQMADMEIHKSTDKQGSSLPTIEFNFKKPDAVEDCQKRCQMMAPELPAQAEAFETLTSNGCVAFTYDIDAGKCTLFMEIELETNWLETLTFNNSQQKPETFRPKRNSVSRVNVPQAVSINQEWITSYRVPSISTLTLHYKIIEITSSNKNLIGCLNACSRLQGNCHEVVFSSVEKICYVRREKSADKSDSENPQEESISEKNNKTSVRNGWISVMFMFKNKAIDQALAKEHGITLPKKLEHYEDNNDNDSKQTSATLIKRMVSMYPYLIFKEFTISHVSAATTANHLQEETLHNQADSTISDYLYVIPSCTSDDQPTCNLNNFELIQIKNMEIEKSTRPTKEIDLDKETDLPETCHNLCIQLKGKTNPDWHVSETNNNSETEFHSCVGYSYEENTGKCLLYEEVSFDGVWIKTLTNSSSDPPKGFLEKRDTTTRIFVPQFEKHQFNLSSHGYWLIGAQLPFDYMTNMGFLIGLVPNVQYTADQIYEPFKSSLNECATSCQGSKHECKQFVYNIESQMCYYVGPEEGDLSRKVLLKVGWISGLYLNITEESSNLDVKCTEDGYYPHPNDCTKFYRCSNGQRFDFDCGPGTHFNPSINNCDWPEKAGCKFADVKNVTEAIITEKKCKTCTKHDHSDNHDHGQHKHTEDEGKEVVLTNEDVWKILHEHGVQDTKKQIESTKVDELTKTIQVPFVDEPKNEQRSVTEPIEHTGDFVDTIHVPHKRAISSFPTCSSPSLSNERTSSSEQKPCKTGTNHDWLQLSDTSLADSDTETHSQVKLKVASSDGDEVANACHLLCQKMTPLDGNTFTSCVAYSFEVSSGTCRLYSKLSLPANWLQMLVTTTTITTTNTTKSSASKSTFKHSPGFKTRLNVPKSQLIMRQWLITPAIPLGISYTTTTDITNSSSTSSGYKSANVETTNFFDCFNVCMKTPNCLAIVYNAFEHKCFLGDKFAVKLFSRETTFVYRSGWVSGMNLLALTSKKSKEVLQTRFGNNRFYIETNPAILDLIEQYLLKKDYNSAIISKSNRKYLNPLDTMYSVTSLEECQNRCSQSWLSENAEEDHSIKLAEDDEIAEDIENQIEPRKKRFLDFKKIYQQHNEKKEAQEAERKRLEVEERLKKYKCKFFSVRENLQTVGTNKTYTCQLFSEDAIEIQIKLLSKLTKPKKSIITKASSEAANFVKDQVGSVTNFFSNPFGKKSRRSAESNELFDDSQVTPVSAYVFYDNPTINFYKVEEPETIRQAEVSQKSYLTWTGITNEQKCFESCLSSWNTLTSTQNTKCRFLVVRAVSADTIAYNCTFYESDPSHPKSGLKELQYEIHSYPYEMPVSFSHSASYFNQITKPDGQMKLQKVETLNDVEEINFCLHHCLKQWLKPKDPFSLEGTKCRHVSVVENSNSDTKFTKYNCTFSDVLEDDNTNSNNNDASQSLGTTGLVAFQLRQLPTTEESKNVSLNHIEYFNPTPVEAETIDNFLGGYKPLYLLDYPQDYSKCLQICVNLWARINLGDTRPDRCRLVVVRKSSGNNQFRQIVTGKPLFQCAIYDMDIEKKLSEPASILHGDQLKLTHVYRKKTTVSDAAEPKIDDYQVIPPSIVAGVFSVISKQAASFYHFTKAISAEQCLNYCLNVKSTGHTEPCNLVVAKAVLGQDAQTDRPQIEYECSLYDYNLDYTFEHTPKESPHVKSYQLVKVLNEDRPQFKLIDADSEPVRYAMQTYEPILTLDKVSSIGVCLAECETLKIKDKLPGFFKSIDCQLAVINPRIIRYETVIDYTCRLYNFNVTEYRLADLDQPKPTQGFELKSDGSSFTDLFNANFKPSKTVDKFNHLSNLQPLHTNARQRKAFYHVAEINDPSECFSLCLNTWAVGFLFNQERRLCRFVTLRAKSTFSNYKFDCALYTHNLTDSLQSLHILIQPPVVGNSKISNLFENQVITSSGTLYSTFPWRVPPPFPTDFTKLITDPEDVGSCLTLCETKLTSCLAVVTMFDVKGTLSKCYLISGDEYYPDNGSFPKGNETSFIQIKVTNIEEAILRSPTSVSQGQQKATSRNNYLSVINSAHLYQLNEPLAEKLSYTL